MFLFMGYSRRTLHYLERIKFSDLADLVAINIETPIIDTRCSLEKGFTELICMNPRIILYRTINQVDSCYSCVRGPLT